MTNSFESKDINIRNIVAVGCDGASVNTGPENGIIRRFEEQLNRPLHWVVCLLHLNELLMHAVMNYAGEYTKGSGLYAGQIGRHLYECHTYPIILYKKVPLRFMPDMAEDVQLSTDQKHLYELAQAVNKGKMPADLEFAKLGE